MRDRRVHDRFDVSGQSFLRARTSSGPFVERLVSLSSGGCGFCSSPEGFSYKVGDEIECEFRVEKKELLDFEAEEVIKIRGRILYIVPQPFEGLIGRFYGIQFFEEESERIHPILDQLRALFRDGKVSYA